MDRLFPEKSKALVKKHLSQTLFNALKQLKTKNGFTLEQAIRSNIENPDSSIGIYAGDRESYTLFSRVFTPVIQEYHGCTVHNEIHTSDLTPINILTPYAFGNQIRSFRIRIARNIADFPFPPLIGSTERSRVEEVAVNALLKLTGDLKGNYMPLEKLTQSQKLELSRKHLLFGRGDRFMESAGINREWPSSRGIFVSDDQTFAVWINEEDHLRIISINSEKNSSQNKIHSVYNRLSRAMFFLEQELTFAHDPHLGFLTSCPSNLGTGMRAGVHICLPNFKNNKEQIRKTVKKYHLQIRGTHGEKTLVENNVLDISNLQRLGITEKQCIETLHNGLTALVDLT